MYDVPNRTQSPYLVNTTFAAAPFYNVDNDGVLKLIFKSTLFIKNTNLTVSNILVNFDDNSGFISTTFNDTLSHTYSTIGNKRLIIKLTFTNGNSVQCYTKVNVTAIPNANNLYQPTNATIPFNPTNSNHSGADITVQYSLNNTTPVGNRRFQKPFIVVEGFDMHDAAPLLMPDGYNYESFRKEITSPSSGFNSRTFNENLDDIAGYDLIFVNWKDGTDDILRNAVVLEEIINWVNANKAPTAQQNVVMGISMGGLVSRYCLAKMTKAGIATQTKLLVTHDSPHRGANIPLGLQHLINDFANTRILFRKLTSWIPLLRQAVVLQKRPATIQQLIVRNNPDVYNSVEYNTFLASNGTYRNMVTFTANDPKPTYRFVATSAGSQCGVPVLQPSQSIASSSGSAGFTFIFGAFGSSLKGTCRVNALPNGTSPQEITYFKLVQKNTIFWINFYTTMFLFQHNSPTGILGWDGCPAGTTPISRGTGLSNLPPTWNSGPWFIPPFLFEYVYNFDGLQVAPEFSFVPTVSALDEVDITVNSLYAPHIAAFYTPTSTTGLQRYITQEETIVNGATVFNIVHTNFTSRNANWIFSEMETIQQPITCQDYCTSTEINGPSEFCNSAAYSLNVPAGSSINWSITPNPNHFVSLVSTGNTAQLYQSPVYNTRNGNSGEITLTANYNSPTCGSGTLSKTIYVGARPPYLSVYAPNGYCAGQPFEAVSSPYSYSYGSISYNWYINSNLNSVHNAKLRSYFPTNPYTYIGVQTITSGCGTSPERCQLFTCENELQKTANSFMVTPMPAKNNITITAKSSFEFSAVKLTNKMGNIIKQWNLPKNTKSTSLNIEGLVSDI